jgi:hypothetical protein
MWTLARYSPAALFSLKPAAATSSGGKTLLTPTPFSIKMALLDSALRTQGLEAGRNLWPIIRDLRIQIALPGTIVVINTFTKIVRPKKNGPSDDRGSGLVTPLGSSIAYREYVQYGGTVRLAFQTATGELMPAAIDQLLAQISYLGKRGGFIQLMGPVEEVDDDAFLRNAEWTTLTADQMAFAAQGTLQMLDDCGPAMTFDQANIYSGKRITLGKERVLRHIVLPYEVRRSSRGYTLYERSE